MNRAIKVTGLISLILMLDQALKIWVKTNMSYGDEIPLFGTDWALMHFVENPGMAFGLVMTGTEGKIVLGIFLLVACISLLYYFKNKSKIETSPALVFSFAGVILATLLLGLSTSNTDYGKLALSLFRIVAIMFLGYYITRLIKENVSWGLLCSFSLILAGAIGNILDSAFYGMIFSDSPYHAGAATMFPEGGGYAGFLHGKVVDMFYFPMYEGFFPSWVPFVGNEPFLFFRPVFNIADIAITTGVLSIIIFHRSFFNVNETAPKTEIAENENKNENKLLDGEAETTEENKNEEKSPEDTEDMS